MSKGRFLGAALALAMLLSGCGAPQRASGPPRIDLPFEHYSLANGLEVILRKDDRVPIAAVNVWYHVGPANEVQGRRGFAHLGEHMMLQGSGHAPGDSFARLQAVGATGVNGKTDFDRTGYLEDVPSNQLELALWLESDRMGFLLDALNQTTLSNQLNVIRNERRQTIENAPYGLAQEEVYHLLFPKEHPYHAYIMGSHEDIQAASLDDVRNFLRQFYVPNNASLAVVGNIDIARTKALIDKYFGTIPRGADVPKPEIVAPRPTMERRKVVTDRVELPRVYMAWVTSEAYTPGDADATVTARLLGGRKGSRLFRRLVYVRKIAQSVSTRQRSLAHGSVFEIVATAKPGHSASKLEKAIEAELKALAREGPGARELAVTKTGLFASAIKSVEPFAAVADRLNSYNHFLGHPDFLNRDLRRFSDVTAARVRKFVAQQLRKDRRVVVHALPGEKVLAPESPALAPPQDIPELKAESSEPWRNEVPKPGPAPPAKLPIAKRFELQNGLPVFLVESHALPIVSAQLTSRSGSAADPSRLPGLMGFSTAMLNEGAGRRDAIEIANDLNTLGSTLDTGLSKEGSWINIQALKDQFPETMAIMKDVALSPTFPEDEIERLRNDRLIALQQQRSRPMTTAYKIMWRELYGPGHPYGHQTLGSRQTIRKTSQEDLKAAYERSFSPRSSALLLTGDLTLAEAKRIANDTFGGWKRTERPKPVPSKGKPGEERVVIVDKPGSPQTALVLAQLGVTRSDPDFERLEVTNEILGGLFASRLNLNLRETKGYTYGVYSEVSANRSVGPVHISTSVETRFTGPAVREVLNEVARLRESGVSDEELQAGRDSILKSLPALFRTNASTTRAVAHLYVLDLPQDYYARLASRLEGITKDDVAAAARKHLDPDKMKVIAVGDRAKIESQVRELELGPIGYRTVDGSAEGPRR